jgi:predicted nucleic acid-binding OB-fold protein
LNQDGNAGRCISGRIHKSEALRNAQKQHFWNIINYDTRAEITVPQFD